MGKDLGEASSLILLGRDASHQNLDLYVYAEVVDGVALGIL